MAQDVGYELIDSGHARKLERFGERLISRPSSLSTWKQRADKNLWDSADATLEIHKDSDSSVGGGWVFSNDAFSTWVATINGVTLELELMSNGQLGIFPEHHLYLPQLKEEMTRLSSQRPLKVLNLFAYTGLATCFCASHEGVVVTHVDMAKRAIERAKINAQLNSLPHESVRWIVDDALAFMAREARKGNRYDIIIIDPPSFSRVSKSNSWTLDDKLAEIVHLFLSVAREDAGAIFFTNHSSASTVDIARNIALDYLKNDRLSIDTHLLSLGERNSTRRLPAGSLITISYGS